MVAGLIEHASRDVHTDASDILVEDLDLSRVDGGADPEPRIGEPLEEIEGAPDRARRCVEGRQDTVTRRPHEAPAEALDLGPGGPVVSIQNLSPAPHPPSAAARPVEST